MTGSICAHCGSLMQLTLAVTVTELLVCRQTGNNILRVLIKPFLNLVMASFLGDLSRSCLPQWCSIYFRYYFAFFKEDVNRPLWCICQVIVVGSFACVA